MVVRIMSNSMRPTLTKGDKALLNCKKRLAIEAGDLVGFMSQRHIPYIHRVISVSQNSITTAADASRKSDTPINRKDIIGKVYMVKQNGKWRHLQASAGRKMLGSTISLFSQRVVDNPASIVSRGIRKMLLYIARLQAAP